MRVLLVGVGGVGEAIAVAAQGRPWLEKMVLAEYNAPRVLEVQRKLANPDRFPVEHVDAGDIQQVAGIAAKHKVDLLMNAVSCDYIDLLFDAAYQYGCTYMDMAMSGTAENMGGYQFERAARWEQKGLLAILGMGADPGMSDVFARYADLHLFDEIDEIGIRDGAALEVSGYEFAPTFSIADTLEECTDPPLIWERDRGWYTTEPFSEPEVFDFPEGIGPIECVNVEHEEVVLIPRRIKCRRVTFKYGLGEKFINVIRVLHMLGLDRKTPVQVKGVLVVPSDVVAACLPDPASLGSRMTGKTCVGTWVRGWRNGRPRQVYIYQTTDNAESMAEHGCQAVSWQTGVCPVIAMELLAEGAWQGQGVLGPEAFDPLPFLRKMEAFSFPYQIREVNP
jgi:saccharopine dehydrogenase (NAD+, L-lysine-forming)